MKKICRVCGEEKDEDKFILNAVKTSVTDYCSQCSGKKSRAQLRLDFLAVFNSTCACCGMTDPRFLTLDHVNNNGKDHREKYNTQQVLREARREGWPKDKYQCLCFNCNLGRALNGGICPHKSITKEEYIDNLKAMIFKADGHRWGNSEERTKRKVAKAIKNLNLTPEQVLELMEKVRGSNGP